MIQPLRFKPALALTLFLFLTGFLIGCNTNQEKSENKRQDTEAQSKDETNLVDTLQAINKQSASQPEKEQTRGGGSEEPAKTIDIGYVNWTEGIAMTHLVEAILEEKMGYTVNKRLGYVGEILDSLAWGTNDIFLDHWLSPDSSLNEMSDFVDAGINYKDAKMGLVVPEYVEANSIEDLKTNSEKFNGRIMGIDVGADVMEKTKKALKVYNLDYELITSSGPAMISSLKNAIKNEKPIVITGWTPHWIFSKFNLKFLEDPKLVYGKTKNIHTLVRKGLEKDHPKIMKFLERFKLNEDQLQDLIENFAQAEDWEKAASLWIKNNKQLVNSWLPKDEA